MEEPDLAMQARTAVACARVATLTTYPRVPPGRPRLTAVTVLATDSGRLALSLEPDSPAVQMLLARPLATLHVAPPGCLPVTLHGAARRVPGTGRGRLLSFEVDVAAVRVGPGARTSVDPEAYAGAEPDPLRHQAPVVLAHLNAGHAGDVAACLRALGHDAQAAHVTGLDRHGLTVQALGADGVSRVRLAFPAPVHRLADLRPGLGTVLTCRCERARGAAG